MQKEVLFIESKQVEEALYDSLYREDELKGGDGVTPEGAIVVEGVVSRFAFQPSRLEAKRAKVTAWLQALPVQFHKNGGEGWSFLNACNQENGVQWTGLHLHMEQLFCLGIGLGLVECLLPREMWDALPGGVPYYAVNLDD